MKELQYEKYILKDSPEVLEILKKEISSGIPLALGVHPTNGLFIIETCGQGPVVIWEEKQ